MSIRKQNQSWHQETEKKTWELTDIDVIQTTLYYVTKLTPQIPSLYETH